MEQLRDFSDIKTNELFVVRHKWFFPYYELTDGVFTYARLSYKTNFRKYAIIETAQATWTIKAKGWFKRSLLINKGEEETIGTLLPQTWKRDVILELDNGFKGTYLYKKLFSKSLVFTHDAYGDILQITQQLWGFKKPFIVTYSQTLPLTDMPPLPLLALSGVNLILLRQAQAAAAGAH